MRNVYITLILALLPMLSSASEGKKYCNTLNFTREEVYDFAYQGLYYEFIGENEVGLVRDSTLVVPMALECSYEKIINLGYEWNRCYTGDIVVPDSVEYNGKKYRVASVNEYAFSFSKGLKSVVFTSNVDFSIDDNNWDSFGHFYMSKDLERVVYHDDTPRLNRHLYYCSNIKDIHFPFNLSLIEYSLCRADLPEIDFGSPDQCRPSHLYFSDCFLPNTRDILGGRTPSLKKQKVKFPECDTLHLKTRGYWSNPELEQSVVIRTCSLVLLESCNFPYYPLKDIKSMTIISEAVTPPDVQFVNQVEENTMYRAQAVLYVPDESMGAYSEAYYWKDFGEIRPMSEYLREENAGVDVPLVDESADARISLSSDRGELRIAATAPAEVTVWSLQGLPLWSGTVTDEVSVTLPRGVYIVTTPGSSRKYRH